LPPLRERQRPQQRGVDDAEDGRIRADAGDVVPVRCRRQIVGIFRTIDNRPELGDVSRPEVILPFSQKPLLDPGVAVRTAGNPDAVRKDVAAAVRSIDPDLPRVNVRTMDEIVRERLASDRRNVALYGGLAAVALLLAALGVYGVMAFSIAQRTPEIGLRMALGAWPAHVRRQILREGAALSAGGLVLGIGGASMLGRAMQSTLFGTGAMNVPVLLAVSARRVLRARAPRERRGSDDRPPTGMRSICVGEGWSRKANRTMALRQACCASRATDSENRTSAVASPGGTLI
jgi:hypothetical protein